LEGLSTTTTWPPPKANTLIPASNLLVVDDTGAILLQRRRDTGQWALPGGAQDVGETSAECAVRECLEEAGIIAEITGFLGVYINPNHIVAYSDGEIRQQHGNTCIDRPIGGAPTTVTQLRVLDRTNEISCFAGLLAPFNLAGVTVTADALHAQRGHARFPRRGQTGALRADGEEEPARTPRAAALPALEAGEHEVLRPQRGPRPQGDPRGAGPDRRRSRLPARRPGRPRCPTPHVPQDRQAQP
jgi:hypothetical protein